MMSLVSAFSKFSNKNTKLTTTLSLFFAIWLLKKMCKANLKSVVGKIIVITGGGSGLGRLFAQRFASLGAKIALVDVSGPALEETKKLLNLPDNRIYTHVADVTNMENIREFKRMVNLHFNGRTYMLINNAGVVAGKYINELSETDIRRTIDVNLSAPIMLTSVFMDDVLANEEGGHIVNVCSAASYIGVSKLTDYCASKAGLIRFTEALMEEVRKRGDITSVQRKNIHTTSVNPYFIATGMFNGVSSYPFILPILTPAWVVDKAVDGILRNQKAVNMPYIVHLTPIIAAITPYWFQNLVADLLGVSRSMENFKGRENNLADQRKE